MTDVTVETSGAEAPADFIAQIALKGEAGAIEINFTALPDQTYQALLIAGAEAFLNKANGAAKCLAGITKLEGKELEDRKKEVLKAAEQTAQQLREGIVPGASPQSSGTDSPATTRGYRPRCQEGKSLRCGIYRSHASRKEHG